jgi:hypothetical protein
LSCRFLAYHPLAKISANSNTFPRGVTAAVKCSGALWLQARFSYFFRDFLKQLDQLNTD